ncbi:hypothetical protein M413DRAFT_233778 [Hebeloma cylindrosporum]|uniref:Uncharacterized protein n=1 Tax=Hebeloma cylindrosporum TaxID=76867 RepID=A0A0C3C3Y4_HEBCY|nr:hypothetical protein M413DRAFT_233778 [Hebeloma cylindrosporum h7]
MRVPDKRGVAGSTRRRCGSEIMISGHLNRSFNNLTHLIQIQRFQNLEKTWINDEYMKKEQLTRVGMLTASEYDEWRQ